MDEVRVEGLLAQVRLRIGDQALTAVITRDAVEELKIRRGDEALAIVKATEVMIAREAEPPGTPPGRGNRAAPALTREITIAYALNPMFTGRHHARHHFHHGHAAGGAA